MSRYWDEKRYYSLDYYLKHTFGKKIYKISLNGGMTCPNRDGTLGSRGCIFCSEADPGDFAGDSRLTITEQIDRGIPLSEKKYGVSSYIAIFRHLPTPMLPVRI